MEWVRRRRRLQAAAGIVRVELVCAASVWSAMSLRCARRYGVARFAEDMQRQAGAGVVRVELSGLELSELMDVAARGSRWWSRGGPADRALCCTVYRAAASAVDEVGSSRGEGVRILPVPLNVVTRT